MEVNATSRTPKFACLGRPVELCGHPVGYRPGKGGQGLRKTLPALWFWGGSRDLNETLQASLLPSSSLPQGGFLRFSYGWGFLSGLAERLHGPLSGLRVQPVWGMTRGPQGEALCL